MNDKLMSCPFCGDTPHLYVCDTDEDPDCSNSISCNCGAKMGNGRAIEVSNDTTLALVRQLTDTMRENERLRKALSSKHPADIAAEETMKALHYAMEPRE